MTCKRITRAALSAGAVLLLANPAAARDALDIDRLDAEEDAVIASMLRGIPEHPSSAPEAVDVILIAKNLERVGDHATNIAEDVILISEARNVKHAAKLAG